MVTLSILTGSNRPGRFNIQPAKWIVEQARIRKGVEVKLLDLQEINLPFLDESMPPMMKQYSKDHTKSWSKMIGESDAYIWVTPEYNHSYSAILKNAIDYLQHEWNYKPVAFVSYGSVAGGSRAVEHLRTVAGELKMYDIREQILIPNYWGGLSDKGQYQFTKEQEKAANSLLDSLVFWAEEMKSSRGKIAE